MISLKCIFGVFVSLLLTDYICHAQFGVGKKKRGTSFEEVQERAQELDAADIDAYGNIGNIMENMGDMGDMGFGDFDMGSMLEQVANNPNLMQILEQLEETGGEAMRMLTEMDPEELAAEMKKAMESLTSPDMLQKMIENKDDVLSNLGASGLLSEEQLKELQDDPEKLENQMKEAISQMSEVFEDPDALKAVTDVANSIVRALDNPDAEGSLKNLMGNMFEIDQDDDKIEEARVQLLGDPELAGTSELASLYNSPEMRAILNDPDKWRETVKKGQGMLFGNEGVLKDI